MFEAYTYEALLENALAQFPADIDKRQGSICYDSVSAIAMQIAKLYIDLDNVFNYVFLGTASGEYLDMKASEFGLSRITATNAKYKFSFKGTTPPVGSRFFHSESGRYFTVDMLDGTFVLVSEDKGESCNDIHSGDRAVPVNTITGLIAAFFGEQIEYGEEDESDESLRKRVQEKISTPAENGTKRDYKTWCESVSGVGLAKIYPLWNGPNSVMAVLISDSGTDCSASVVKAVQQYVDPDTKGEKGYFGKNTCAIGDGLGEGAANLGAHFTAVSAVPYQILISFNAVLKSGFSVSDAENEVKKKMLEYLKKISLSANDSDDVIVRISAVGALILECKTIVDYSDLKINGSTSNCAIGKYYVPVLSEVEINDQ